MKLKILLVVLLLPMLSCTRTYMVKTDTTKAIVQEVNVIAVSYRRPDFAPADPEDFSNKNRPFECMPSNQLWKDAFANQKNILECLNSIEEAKAIYLYVPDVQPYLEFDVEEETNPKCLKAVLPKIPLPREIYYLGREEGKAYDQEPQSCYSSSFSTKTNEMMKTPTGFLKKKISLPFPLDRKLKTTNDLAMWLIVTTFSILKSDDQADRKIVGKLVPDYICKACFKHDAFFDDKYSGRMKPVFWP